MLSFTACVWIGIVMISMIRSTSITSMRGVVLMSTITSGSPPPALPTVIAMSEPLDRAAYSSVRASNPFEPLPGQFKGPYIELRYRYYYNILPEDYNQPR